MNLKITCFEDYRGLPVCRLIEEYCKQDKIVLDDEQGSNAALLYSEGNRVEQALLPHIDWEQEIYRKTGKGGCKLPSDPALREQLRAVAKRALENYRKANQSLWLEALIPDGRDTQ